MKKSSVIVACCMALAPVAPARTSPGMLIDRAARGGADSTPPATVPRAHGAAQSSTEREAWTQFPVPISH